MGETLSPFSFALTEENKIDDLGDGTYRAVPIMDENGKIRVAGKIDFTSTAHRDHILKLSEWLLENSYLSDGGLRALYGKNATGWEKWDYKREGLSKDTPYGVARDHWYRGAQISVGVYVSARDVGNWEAGMVAKVTNQSKLEFMLYAGALELSQQEGRSKFGYGWDLLTGRGQANASQVGTPTYGEKFMSNFFQRLGYEQIMSGPVDLQRVFRD